MARGKVLSVISGFAATFTVSAAVLGIGKLRPAIAEMSLLATLGALAGAAIGSLLVYSLILRALTSLFSNVRFIRRLILGKQFLEGTWVGGYYVGADWHVSIEQIDQTGEEISITGRQIDPTGRLHAKWRSTSAALDPHGKLLCYSYDCEMIATSKVHRGIGIFDVVPVERGAPVQLDGYSMDTTDGEADPNTEHKVGPLGMDQGAILEAARKHFSQI